MLNLTKAPIFLVIEKQDKFVKNIYIKKKR